MNVKKKSKTLQEQNRSRIVTNSKARENVSRAFEL